MILVPTRVCNNKCNYCWVYKNDFSIKYFDNFGLDDFFEKLLYISSITDDQKIRFFWWESFLKFDIIKKIIKKEYFNYSINTNLSLINNDKLKFIKKNNVKLIFSCNWRLKSHLKTRWNNIKETLKLYKNIKIITKNYNNYQINFVTTPENVDNLYNNLFFINKKLWWKIINFLPVLYNGWNKNSLKILKKELEIVKKNIKNKKLNLNFINKEVNNNVWLFNNEILIDSDWNIYPSMVVMEKFFQDKKNKILITNIEKSLDLIKEDFKNWENKDYKIYNAYINKTINKKFDQILVNDKIVSEIFKDFFNSI